MVDDTTVFQYLSRVCSQVAVPDLTVGQIAVAQDQFAAEVKRKAQAEKNAAAKESAKRRSR